MSTEYKAHVALPVWSSERQQYIRVPVDIEYSIDWNTLLELLAARVTGNTTGRTQYLNGIIKARRRIIK